MENLTDESADALFSENDEAHNNISNSQLVRASILSANRESSMASNDCSKDIIQQLLIVTPPSTSKYRESATLFKSGKSLQSSQGVSIDTLLKSLSSHIQQQSLLSHSIKGDLPYISSALNGSIGRRYIPREVIHIPKCFALHLFCDIDVVNKFKFVKSVGSLKLYERGIEARASLDLHVDEEVVAYLLTATTQYHQWLLGNKCQEVTRISQCSDLVTFSFKQKQCWPLTPKLITTQVVRAAFINPQTDQYVVAFNCDLFQLNCVFDSNKMHISCHSSKYCFDLIQKVADFCVFAEMQALEQSDVARLDLRRYKFVEEREEECVYHEESSIPLGEESVTSSSPFKRACSLRDVRPSIVKQQQPCSDSDHNSIGHDSDAETDFVPPRENLQVISASQCKDSKGEWTKWVPERLDEEQKKVYADYQKLIIGQPHLNHISVNNHLRFLNGCKWNAAKALEYLNAAEKFRESKNLHLTRISMFQSLIDMDYAKHFGWDKLGRPVVWLQLKNFNPAGTNNDQITRFMVYMLDYLGAVMKANVDQFIMVVDLKDFGYSNFSLETFKAIANITGTLYSGRMSKAIMLNSSTFFSWTWSSIKGFLLERQRNRIEFVDQANETQYLQSLMDPSYILKDYKGLGPAFNSFKQTFPAHYK